MDTQEPLDPAELVRLTKALAPGEDDPRKELRKQIIDTSGKIPNATKENAPDTVWHPIYVELHGIYRQLPADEPAVMNWWAQVTKFEIASMAKVVSAAKAALEKCTTPPASIDEDTGVNPTWPVLISIDHRIIEALDSIKKERVGPDQVDSLIKLVCRTVMHPYNLIMETAPRVA